ARVIPLCLAAKQISPEYQSLFQSALGWLGPELESRIIFPVPGINPDTQDTIMGWLQAHGPATPGKIRDNLGTAEGVLEKHLDHLSRNQQIISCGFTPTDALHCLDKLALGDRKYSMAGARQLSAYHHLEIQTFAEHILTLARNTIARTVLEYVSGREIHNGLAAFLHRREENPLVEVTIKIKPPIIGIGAGAPFFLPQVAEQLGTTVTFPEHFQVGNAVGAAWIGMDSAKHTP
ncbi:MAG: hypothetical protein PHS63_07015, partial [Desulfoplanes sp.]|nr:hypothetical protein [Desulfoplanes sp.]